MGLKLNNFFNKLGNVLSLIDATNFGTQDVKHLRGNWYKHPLSGEFCVPMMLGQPFCPDRGAYESELVYMRKDKPDNQKKPGEPGYDPKKMFDHTLANVAFVDAPISKAEGIDEAVRTIEHMNAELESRGYQRVSDAHVEFHQASRTNTSDPMYRVLRDLGIARIHTAKRIEGMAPTHIVARGITLLTA